MDDVLCYARAVLSFPVLFCNPCPRVSGYFLLRFDLPPVWIFCSRPGCLHLCHIVWRVFLQLSPTGCLLCPTVCCSWCLWIICLRSCHAHEHEVLIIRKLISVAALNFHPNSDFCFFVFLNDDNDCPLTVVYSGNNLSTIQCVKRFLLQIYGKSIMRRCSSLYYIWEKTIFGISELILELSRIQHVSCIS